MVAKLRRLLPYALRQWPKLLAILVLTVSASAATVLQPWPMKILVDYALGDMAVPERVDSTLRTFSLSASPEVLIVVAGLATLALFLINSAFDVALSWSWVATGQRMVYELAADVFAHLQRLSLRFHGRQRVGDLLSRLNGDTWCVYSIVSELSVSPVQQIITLMGIGTVAWMLSPRLTVLIFSVAPVLGGSVFYFGPRLKRRAKRQREVAARLTSFVHQTVTSIPLVQAFSAEERNQALFDSLVEDSVAASQQGVLIGKSFALVNGLANSTGRAIVMFFGGLQVLAGNMSVGTLLVFLGYVRVLQEACKNLLTVYSSLKASEASVDRLLEILDAEEMVRETRDARPVPNGKSAHGDQVVFEDVTFGYEPGRPVLRGISFEARPGEQIAVVGPTGAGKSTLVSLIPRFFDPWEGKILINGLDARDARLEDLRSRVAMVMQDPFLLPRSIAENIAYGRRGARPEQIVAAARAANAHEFIDRLPQGYESVLGQRGSTLSGGQRQRLAIARAFVRDAPIVILDEPTSALDVETEAGLLEALARLTAGRTTFVIAHRLSTIRNADRVVVLQDGRIAEMGTHEELLARRKIYHRLHTIQFGPATQEMEV